GLFGDRAVIGNATGCSSIYGGNLPTTPYSVNKEGLGPAWSNSLFEDAAEFGLGFRLTLTQQEQYARILVDQLRPVLGDGLCDAILTADQTSEAGISAQRRRVGEAKRALGGTTDRTGLEFLSVADSLVKKSVWSLGGDGWAYDIGYGGLDHVFSTSHDVNLLVMDTEVYSNTGGQASKATARGAVAKFATDGKPSAKKDLGRMAMNYGTVYVASVAMGANDAQTVRAFIEAESYRGPSVIIAYSHCISHGIDMAKGLAQQKLAVESGAVMLYRFDPRLTAEGKNPLQIDSKAPSVPLADFIYSENRYRMLQQSDPASAARLLASAQADVNARWQAYQHMASAPVPGV
ncbi:MAG: pyruvate:ferredoxin (flavodoxin) oxidoreductase, partial [Armatimonadetes bacterium]|nr:pyruvate:ferredoxin (flavodoxin) oxidoreductase [Armatimonadota bacterium]